MTMVKLNKEEIAEMIGAGYILSNDVNKVYAMPMAVKEENTVRNAVKRNPAVLTALHLHDIQFNIMTSEIEYIRIATDELSNHTKKIQDFTSTKNNEMAAYKVNFTEFGNAEEKVVITYQHTDETSTYTKALVFIKI